MYALNNSTSWFTTLVNQPFTIWTCTSILCVLLVMDPVSRKEVNLTFTPSLKSFGYLSTGEIYIGTYDTSNDGVSRTLWQLSVSSVACQIQWF